MRLWVVAMLVIWGLVRSPVAFAEDVTLSTETFGAWKVNQLEDQIDGSVRWLAVAVSADGKSAFGLKCDGGSDRAVYASFITAKYLGSDDTRDLTWRVDKNPPQTVRWNYDKHSASGFDTAQVWKMVREIRAGKTLRVRALNYEFVPVDSVLPIDGAAAALKKVYQGCGDTQWID